MDVKQLILHAIYGGLSDRERDELNHWLETEDNRRVYEKICRHLEKRDAVEFIAELDTEAALRKTRRRLRRSRTVVLTIGVSIAAIVLIGLLINPVVKTAIPSSETGSYTTITLASGEILKLDGSEIEHFSDDADIRVSGEKINVRAGKAQVSAPAFNTLTVPHGENYTITLADGTRVWVNALSSLKFPASFEGAAERVVELTGEGYFEVAHDSIHPFRVISSRQTIFVTGTEFNISAYEGEVCRTTLCCGSVIVETAAGEKQHLLPGQQFSVDPSGITTVAEVNTDLYTAWRKGEYYFDNQTLDEVFLTLGRWFDIREVNFNDPAMKMRLFSGKLRKSDGLEIILQVIERGTQGRIDYHKGQLDIGEK